MKINCDIAIVGAGAGGLSVAAASAQLGMKVVLIERHNMGGDCLNYGCIPSKALLSVAKCKANSEQALEYGISVDNIQVNFQEVMAYVKKVIKTIEVNDSVERFEGMGVQVIKEEGSFLNKKSLQAGEYNIEAKYFIIATGSSPAVPPISGLTNIPYLTNETIFDLKQLPGHLVVIGGGPIGCELAQAFHRLGSKVSIIEGLTILPKDEPDCTSILREQFKKEGIELYEQASIENIKEDSGVITVVAKKQDENFSVVGTHVLLAAGRKPNITSLALEKAGIKHHRQGIVVDKRLRTSNKKVFAIGDVTGGLQFTHMAGYHAGIVIKNMLFKLPAKINITAVPWVTYTTPELAHVGMMEAEVRKSGKEISVVEWPFVDNDRAQVEGKTVGKIKVVASKKGMILGVSIVGEGAGELILPWVAAVQNRKTFKAFTDIIAPYPTRSEISKRVAGQYYTPVLFSKKTKRLVKWLNRLF